MNAWHGQRLIFVDALDFGMGIGTHHKAGVQHAGQLQVGRVLQMARDLGASVDERRWSANKGKI